MQIMYSTTSHNVLTPLLQLFIEALKSLCSISTHSRPFQECAQDTLKFLGLYKLSLISTFDRIEHERVFTIEENFWNYKLT